MKKLLSKAGELLKRVFIIETDDKLIESSGQPTGNDLRELLKKREEIEKRLELHHSWENMQELVRLDECIEEMLRKPDTKPLKVSLN